MAWIEVHQELRGHPKVTRLATLMGLDDLQALGLLVNLWLWAAQYAQNGDLTQFSDVEICAACGLEKRYSNVIVTNLIQSGWVDEGDEKRLIHHWGDYGLKFLDATKNRVRDFRERKRAEKCDTDHGNVTVTPTLPNLTLPKSIFFNSPDFVSAWDQYRQMRVEKKKTMRATTERAQLKNVEKLSERHVRVATRIVMASVENGWTGLFPLKVDVLDQLRREMAAEEKLKKHPCEYCGEPITESQQTNHQRIGICSGWKEAPVETVADVKKKIIEIGQQMSVDATFAASDKKDREAREARTRARK